MSDKWTPAPWAQTPYSSVLGVVITAQPDATQNSQRIAGVGGPQVRKVIEANARLIAAAPDMAKALAKIIDALNTDTRQKSIIGDDVEYHLDGGTMSLAINSARAALAKARGLA